MQFKSFSIDRSVRVKFQCHFILQRNKIWWSVCSASLFSNFQSRLSCWRVRSEFWFQSFHAVIATLKYSFDKFFVFLAGISGPPNPNWSEIYKILSALVRSEIFKFFLVPDRPGLDLSFFLSWPADPWFWIILHLDELPN